MALVAINILGELFVFIKESVQSCCCKKKPKSAENLPQGSKVASQIITYKRPSLEAAKIQQFDNGDALEYLDDEEEKKIEHQVYPRFKVAAFRKRDKFSELKQEHRLSKYKDREPSALKPGHVALGKLREPQGRYDINQIMTGNYLARLTPNNSSKSLSKQKVLQSRMASNELLYKHNKVSNQLQESSGIESNDSSLSISKQLKLFKEKPQIQQSIPFLELRGQESIESGVDQERSRSPKFSLVPKKLRNMMLKNQIKLQKDKFIKRPVQEKSAKKDE